MYNRFKKGSGCFTCESCGKLTRNTGRGTGLCAFCNDSFELENSFNDGCISREQFEKSLEALKHEYKRG